MNVVHVETGRHFYGGAEQVLYLSQGLLARGVDSTIVCQADSAIDRAARSKGLPVATIPCGGDLDVLFAFRLKAWLSQSNPDLVHCHSRRGADFFGGRAAAMAGIPALLSRRVDSKDSGLVAGIRYSPFRSVVAISETVRRALRDSGVSDENIVTIRSAVDASAMQNPVDRQVWLREFDLTADNVVAIVAAQLIERKGHVYLLEALPELCRVHENFRLIVFGRGPLESELRERTTRLGLDDHVQFAGFRDDLDNFLGCADLAVHPALKEGLGVAMLKAAAAGLPVVAFDNAGAQEAVIDQQTGLLVPPRDVASLLQALRQLVENPVRRKSLGKAGQSRMQSEFSIDVMVDQHLHLYQSIADGSQK